VLDCLDRAAELFPEDSLDNVETRAEVISAWSDDDEEIDATLEDIDDELRDLFEGLEEKLDRYVMEDPRDDDWSE
jgi:phosphate uptake regulator